jgi:hypothetical protein
MEPTVFRVLALAFWQAFFPERLLGKWVGEGGSLGRFTLLLSPKFMIKKSNRALTFGKKKNLLAEIAPIELPELEDPKKSPEAAWTWADEFDFCSIKLIYSNSKAK